MILWRKIELLRLAPAPHFLIRGFVRTDRNLGVGNIRQVDEYFPDRGVSLLATHLQLGLFDL